MSDSKENSLAIIKRAAMQRAQLEARFEDAERESARWPNKLRFGIVGLLWIFVGSFLSLFAIVFPRMTPADPAGLGYFALASTVFGLLFVAAVFVEQWVGDRAEWYWFWRISTALSFLALGGGLLYGMYISAPIWLPHFR